jgi:hypothetical protein
VNAPNDGPATLSPRGPRAVPRAPSLVGAVVALLSVAALAAGAWARPGVATRREAAASAEARAPERVAPTDAPGDPMACAPSVAAPRARPPSDARPTEALEPLALARGEALGCGEIQCARDADCPSQCGGCIAWSGTCALFRPR